MIHTHTHTKGKDPRQGYRQAATLLDDLDSREGGQGTREEAHALPNLIVRLTWSSGPFSLYTFRYAYLAVP